MGITSLSQTLNEALHTHVAVSIEDLASFPGALSLRYLSTLGNQVH